MISQERISYRQEESGIIGISGHPDAVGLAFSGLCALQHRGRRSAGIVSCDGHRTRRHAGEGIVSEVFTKKLLDSLRGPTAMGHAGSSTGNVSTMDIQPFTAGHKNRIISVAHNGSFTNILSLRNELKARNAIFLSSIDSEVVSHFLACCDSTDLAQGLKSVFEKVEGAYSLIMLVNETLVAVRDPHGFRPLSLGRLPAGGYVIASETCAFEVIGAEYLRDIEPGEISIINGSELHSCRFAADHPKRFCLFEQVFFARPDSDIYGSNVYSSRKKMGEALAGECRISADLVISLPGSATGAALGYSQATGIPFEIGLIRNDYTCGRLPAHSDESQRWPAITEYSPVRSVINGKRIIVVDDSAASRTVISNTIRMLQKAGAREIHLLASCPPVRFSCDYGMHFPGRENPFAYLKSPEEILIPIGLDSFHHLSLEGLLNAVGGSKDSHCKACVDGIYPLGLESAIGNS